jgi:hypothetical protein
MCIFSQCHSYNTNHAIPCEPSHSLRSVQFAQATQSCWCLGAWSAQSFALAPGDPPMHSSEEVVDTALYWVARGILFVINNKASCLNIHMLTARTKVKAELQGFCTLPEVVGRAHHLGIFPTASKSRRWELADLQFYQSSQSIPNCESNSMFLGTFLINFLGTKNVLSYLKWVRPS